MEIDLEKSLCKQEKVELRADKDVSVVDVTDEVNVGEERVSFPTMSACVKEGLNVDQSVASFSADKGIYIVDVTDEGNVEEDRVSSSPTMSERVKEVHGLNVDQNVSSLRSDKEIDVVDVTDEVNVREERDEHVKEVHVLNADQSVCSLRSDKDVDVVDVTDEGNFEERVSFLKTSECVKEVHGLNADQSVSSLRSDKAVDVVDVTDEGNVEEHVRFPTMSECVKEVHVFNVDQSVSSLRSDKDVDVVDVTDEGNVEEERVSSPTKMEHFREAHELNANQSASSFRSDKVVGTVDVTDEVNVEEEHVSFLKSSENMEEVNGLNANQTVSTFQGQDDVEVVGVNAVDKGKGVVVEPRSGMVFESKEEAYAYYREYARSVGFGITIKASRRSKKSGNFIDIKIACSRFGSNRESAKTVNPRIGITKTDCKACLHIKRRADEKWVVHSFAKEHNHEIGSDDLCCTISGKNKKPTVDCQKKGLRSVLFEEDVRVMFRHFMCMQDEDPNFFYAIDFDHEKQLRSVLWVDTKCRRDYSCFCDVVMFDTYYVRNNYKIPLVPVVGVNHHFQYILLGCALIGEETTSAFVWLMQTWLKAVGGQAPRLVITDQDTFLKEAVADVFTDAQHCFCLWHVLTRVHENVGCLTEENEILMEKFNKCISRSWTDEQFQKKWWKLVDRFELRGNEWVHSLYEDRKKWVPAYLHDSFLAGMSTKERSGSISSFFDRYISPEATVKDFIEQYKAFQKDRDNMEANAAIETQDKQPGLKSLSPFEKQMSTIYTHAVFENFQVEILGVASCQLQKDGENEAAVIFRVDDSKERQSFIVSWNEAELKVCCLCHSFEYRGFLCRHAILVLQESGVSRIPSHYILKRWTKDAKARHTVSDVPKKLDYRVRRFNDLCKLAVKLGEEGSLSLESYHVAFEAIEAVMKQCVDVNNSVNHAANHGFNNSEEVNLSSSMAKSSKKKKTNKKRKERTEPDDITIRLQDSSQLMEQMKSRAHNLEKCYAPQHELEREHGSRSRGLESYYSAQQSMQGMGQMNSFSPIRDAYYDNQQATQGQLHSLPARLAHYGTQQSMQGGMVQGHLSFRALTARNCFDIQGSLQDMELSVGSPDFHGNASKHPQNKHQKQ